MLTGLLVHFLWEPWRFFSLRWIDPILGWPLIAAGTLLSVWGLRTMFGASVALRRDTSRDCSATSTCDTRPAFAAGSEV
jgi:hypothetical protein